MTLLQAQGLSLSFGRVAALQNLDLSIAPGERHALIGPNGAGKTTLINVLTGALSADRGKVVLGGQDVTSLAPDQRTRRGLVRTFQINSLFPHLTALDSVALAVCERQGLGGHWWRTLRRQQHVFDEAADWLNRFGLAGIAKLRVAHLPYGQQRLLEIALALACRPQLLLLDEPAAGLPTHESRAMLDVIKALPQDMAVLLIEHDMDLVFKFADTISVLDGGRMIAQGSPEQIAADQQVRTTYLGAA